MASNYFGPLYLTLLTFFVFIAPRNPRLLQASQCPSPLPPFPLLPLPPPPTPPPQVTMASNYFGPLYLTLQLLDVLQASAPSRIVWVNSVGSQLVNPPYLGGNSWAPGEALMYMDVPRPRGTFGACMNFWVQAGWLDSIEVHSTTRQARDTQHLS
jgi:hypothetical protein